MQYKRVTTIITYKIQLQKKNYHKRRVAHAQQHAICMLENKNDEVFKTGNITIYSV